MSNADKIDIDIFKVVTRAIAESDNLGIMTDHLAQLLVGALDIKACSLFAFNKQTEELEILGSFGLSIDYINKGPLLADKSIGCLLKKEAMVVGDVTRTDLLQYPEAAEKEGVAAIVSVPIIFLGKAIGTLRLYHHQVWDVSQRDLDSLFLLAETIGLAMGYTRLRNTLNSVNGILKDLHRVWLAP